MPKRTIKSLSAYRLCGRVVAVTEHGHLWKHGPKGNPCELSGAFTNTLNRIPRIAAARTPQGEE